MTLQDSRLGPRADALAAQFDLLDGVLVLFDDNRESLHARFFLEMIVRYSKLDRPPVPLPSGYAALLCLYGLR